MKEGEKTVIQLFVPALSKILEKVITNRVISFLDKHNIFNKSQLGFRKNESTKDAIATIIKNTTENLNNKIKCNCVLLYLSRTFDCIEHNICHEQDLEDCILVTSLYYSMP
jgi:hypothetical protein